MDLDLQHYQWERDCLYYLRLVEHLFAPLLWLIAIYFAISLPRISLIHKNLRIVLASLF